MAAVQGAVRAGTQGRARPDAPFGEEEGFAMGDKAGKVLGDAALANVTGGGAETEDHADLPRSGDIAVGPNALWFVCPVPTCAFTTCDEKLWADHLGANPTHALLG